MKMKIFDRFYSITSLTTWEALKDIPDFRSVEDAKIYAKENNIDIEVENRILYKRIGTEINLGDK